MTELTGFESQPIDQKRIPEVSDILAALSVNLELAENLFSRLVKHRIYEAAQPFKTKLDNSGSLIVPTWMHSAAVVIEPAMSKTFINQAIERMLFQLTNALITSSIERAKVGTLIFRDSCRATIKKVGANLYSFAIRQTWSLGFNSEEDAKSALFGES